MAKELNPQVRVVDGRILVNRDWMAAHSGAKVSTVNYWYSAAATWPEGVTPPPKVTTIDRTGYYDQQAFQDFYSDWQESKQNKLTQADPALWEGDPDDLISINQAAEWFHYASPAVIRKFDKANPGYFAPQAGTVEGPSGRPIPAYRRADLQAFEKRRTGDNTGAAGAPAGRKVSRERTRKVLERIELARLRIEEAGGWRRGLAADLAEEHGESERTWERYVKEAREALAAAEQPAADPADAYEGNADERTTP